MARRKGKKFRAPLKLNDEVIARIDALLLEGKGKRETASLLGLGEVTIYGCLANRNNLTKNNLEINNYSE